MNRRTVLALRWTAWSLATLGVTTGATLWIARADRKPVDPGSRDVAGLTDALARSLPADCPRLTFTDHAERLGLRPQFAGTRTHQLPEDMGGGVAVADFDGDGDLDVLFVGTGAMPEGGPSSLWRNDTAPGGAGGALALADVTDSAGLGGPLMGMGAAVADVDGDGDLDVLLTHLAGVRLLRNDGGLRFVDVTAENGLAGADGWCAGAAFGDADGDGDLDLYVGRYVAYRKVEGRADLAMYGMQVPYTLNPSSFPPLANLYFRNRGDGTFEGGEELAKSMGIDNPRGRSLSVVFADLDRDGMADLYVANDVSDNALYRGVVGPEGARGFQDWSYQSATADYRGAMGIAVGDTEGDGDDDLFITHWLAQENAHYRNLAVDPKRKAPVLMFTDDADRVGLGAVALDFVGWGTDYVDFDLDGRADLFVANGSTIEDPQERTRLVPQRPLVFWNAGEPRGFFETGTSWDGDLARPRGLRGAAAADLDRDGDADLVLGALEGRPAVLVNDGPPRSRSLTVRLRAPAPNTFAIGARVTVTCGEFTLSRELRSAPSYLSAGPPELLFGLGSALGPATVEVRWPDGARSTVAAEATQLEIEHPASVR